MAINYTKINEGRGWDNNSYINPSNMNHMDDGIKAACDGVDAIGTNYIKASNATTQKVTMTSGSGDTALSVQGRSPAAAYIGYFDNSGTELGYVGVNSSKKPQFYDTSPHEIALAESFTPTSIALSAFTPTNYASYVTFVGHRTGKVVCLNMSLAPNGGYNIPANTDVNLGTLSSELRPAMVSYGTTMFSMNGGNGNAYITDTGEIHISSPASIPAYNYFTVSITFIIRA